MRRTRNFVPITLAVICGGLSAQNLPDKPHFEVASIKPAAPPDLPPEQRALMEQMMRNRRMTGQLLMRNPGLVRLQNWTLVDLIAASYRVPAIQVVGPSWLTKPAQFFDVEAKLPEGASKDLAYAMLQSLLEERFGLRTHRETQTRPGFVLVVGKNGPKLQPAEPEPSNNLTPEENRVKMSQHMAEMMEKMHESRNNGMPMAGFSTLSWASVTAEELAANLIRFVDAPVVDQTGLTAKYSVRIETWKGEGDNPGVTIFDAVEKLGLKLESRKVTVEAVVVDQVSKMPSEN